MLAGDRHLCGDDLRLDRGCQPFCLVETKPEVGQTRLLIAFEARDLDLRCLPGLKLRHQLDPSHQLSCPFSSGTDAKFHPVLFFRLNFADASMHGGGRALSDG